MCLLSMQKVKALRQAFRHKCDHPLNFTKKNCILQIKITVQAVKGIQEVSKGLHFDYIKGQCLQVFRNTAFSQTPANPLKKLLGVQ